MKKKVWVYPATEQTGLVALEGKAQGLLDLDMLGFPVPRAFIVTRKVYEWAQQDNARLEEEVIARLVEEICRHFCNPKPVLVSLRCGHKSKKNTPQLLPTSVLNLGLDDAFYKEAVEDQKMPEYFLDALIQNCIDHARAFFEFMHQEMPDGFATMLLRDQMSSLIQHLFTHFAHIETQYKNVLDPTLIIQEMVYGNLSDDSLTGMCYTRHPYTGEVMDYGVFIQRRQGMSLGGIHSDQQQDLAEMKNIAPEAYDQLQAICKALETHYKDIRCLEFTVQQGKLYILQNTIGNRTFKI